MKRTRRIVSILLMLALLLPSLGLADGAYEELKTLMGLQLVSDIDVPTYLDVTSQVEETSNNCTCIISLTDNYIGISGTTKNGKYERLFYGALSPDQLILYTVSICTMYDTIDKAKTTADSFTIILVAGDGEDNIVVINDSATAKKVTEIISDALK